MRAVRALGIDVGSATIKVVAVDASGEMLWHALEETQPRIEDQASRLLTSAPGWEAGSLPLLATGCGRRLVRQAARSVTEITCHARGVYRALGHGGTLVDIGGQDSKVIIIGAGGEVLDFAMNDRCAAGTGRFLENTARRLGVELERLGEVCRAAKGEVAITSTCTVFAESEIVSLLAHGEAMEPILKGVHRSLIRRVVSMIRSIGWTSPLMLSGGVVRNSAIAWLLEQETGERIVVPPQPQLMGAYGAALLAVGDGRTAA